MGKASKRKEKRREKNSTTAGPAVLKMLTDNTNPLVSITLVGPPKHPDDPMPLSRSMGFVVDRFSSGLRLVVTCRHALDSFDAPGYRTIIGFENPRPKIVTMVGEPILDVRPESDIAYLLVRDPLDAPTRPFEVQPEDPPLIGKRILYNARNRCEPGLGVPGLYVVSTFRQKAKEMNYLAFCKFTSKDVVLWDRSNHAKHAELEHDGWIRSRSFQMVSRPGYSGSPIWDDELRLYGMNFRGTEPSDIDYEKFGDVATCIPVSELYSARQRVDEILRARLASLNDQ